MWLASKKKVKKIVKKKKKTIYSEDNISLLCARGAFSIASQHKFR